MANWLDKYAMGGALPGATGMMYARTQDPAPSNGPYAKKTLASAQDGKEMPKAYWASNNERDAYRKNLKAAAEAALTNNASDEDLLINTSYHDMNSGNNCMSGVCGLNRKAGLTYNAPTDNDRFLSGEKFAQAVAKGYEDYYQVSGNFQPGDHLQYRHKEGSSSHNKIIYDIQVDDKGEKIYKVIDNAGGKDMRSRDYTEAELKELVEKGGGGYDKVNIYRPGYNLDKPLLDKEREAKTSPEARAALAERKNIQEWDASHNPGFDYSIRPESEYYNKQPEGMKKFIDFANDDAKVTALAKKLNVGKDIIHDQLLNTFGELGQENKWADRWFGGTLGIENTIEKITSPQGWSIGPGQIKYKTLDPELKKQFDINRPKDLHDIDKVIPLMTAINVKNKKWMENQGDDLSTKLIGTPGVSADEIKYGVDRWVPYAYQGLPTDPVASVRRDAQENANSYRMSTKDREDYINNYIKKNINPDKIKTFDEGSYAGRVYDLIDKNLSRTMPAQNYEQYNELMPVTVKSKKKMQKGGVIKDDRGQWAHPGEITEIGSNDITMQGVDYPVLGVSDTGDTQMMYPDQDYKFDGKKVTEFPMAQNGDWLSKYATEPMRQDATRNVIPRKMTDKEKLEAVTASDEAQKRALNTAKEVISERKKNKATKGDLNTPGSWNIKEKARLFPSSVGGAGEMFDEYINPATYVGVLADALGESVAARDPKGIALSLALSAGAGAMGLDPLGSAIKGVKTIPKATRAGLNAIDRNFSNVGKELVRIEKEGLKKGWDPQKIKTIQLEEVGITANQREAYVPGVSDALQKYVYPQGYGVVGGESKLTQTIRAITTGTRTKSIPSREDAWRTYLGMPQEYNTFRMAETVPVNHPAYTPKQLSKMDIYSINDKFLYDDDLYSNLEGIGPRAIDETTIGLPETIAAILEKNSNMVTNPISYDYNYPVMGGYNKRLNQYGLEYNDIWDLEPELFGKKIKIDKFIGKPFMSHEVLPDITSEKVKSLVTSQIKSADAEFKPMIEYYKNLDKGLISYSRQIAEYENALNRVNKLKQPLGIDQDIMTTSNGWGTKDWNNTINNPNFKKENGGWLDKYQDGGTLMRDKKVGEKISEVAKYDLRLIKPNFKNTTKEVYDPNCPDGIGCSKQATDIAQSITGLPRVAYAPSDAAYRDAVAERTGLINVFNQEGEQKTNANSNTSGWKYPTEQDFTTWRVGDIVTLDAGKDRYFGYKSPKGYTSSDNSGVTHNGVITGFTETGRPIITHGGASGKYKGKQYSEVLGDDNRVRNLGHGRYAVKSVWRPKEVDLSGKVSSIENVIDIGEERAGRKQSTTSNQSFYLKPTEEEKLQKDYPVGYEFSGASNRLNTKNKLVNLFNDEKLDKDLQYKLGITAQELDKLKPVVYGVFGQESNFNDVDSGGASFKELIGNLFGNNSRGGAQIKMSSLTVDEKKVLGIKKASDLDKDEVAYKASLLMLNNSRKRMNQEVEQGTHPELADKDEYFRAGYYYNSPARAIQSSDKFTKRKNKNATFSDVKKNELRMDEGSYPYKLMERAKDLGVNMDFDTITELEPVVVRSMVKNNKGTTFVPKQETGGWLNKYK